MSTGSLLERWTLAFFLGRSAGAAWWRCSSSGGEEGGGSSSSSSWVTHAEGDSVSGLVSKASEEKQWYLYNTQHLLHQSLCNQEHPSSFIKASKLHQMNAGWKQPLSHKYKLLLQQDIIVDVVVDAIGTHTTLVLLLSCVLSAVIPQISPLVYQ